MDNSLNTERQSLVQVIFGFPRVGEGYAVECKDRRWKFSDIIEVESKRLGYFHLLNQTSSLHLIDDLLLRFCLLDKIGICASGGNKSERCQQ